MPSCQASTAAGAGMAHTCRGYSRRSLAGPEVHVPENPNHLRRASRRAGQSDARAAPRARHHRQRGPHAIIWRIQGLPLKTPRATPGPGMGSSPVRSGAGRPARRPPWRPVRWPPCSGPMRPGPRCGPLRPPGPPLPLYPEPTPPRRRSRRPDLAGKPSPPDPRPPCASGGRTAAGNGARAEVAAWGGGHATWAAPRHRAARRGWG